jgi:hypothetical protein
MTLSIKSPFIFIHYLYLTLQLTVTGVIVREVIIRLMHYTHPSYGKLHV